MAGVVGAYYLQTTQKVKETHPKPAISIKFVHKCILLQFDHWRLLRS